MKTPPPAEKPVEKTSEVLNLGLSQILESQNSGSMNGSPDKAPKLFEHTPGGNSTSACSELPANPFSKAVALSKARQWNDLASYCEVLLSSNPDQADIRVFWVLAQFRLKRMPLSILAGPLESASSKLLDRIENDSAGWPEISQTKDLLFSTLHEVGKELQLQNEHHLALVFLERAYTLSKAARSDFIAALNSELKQLGLKRGRPNGEGHRKERERLERLKMSVERTASTESIDKVLAKAQRAGPVAKYSRQAICLVALLFAAALAGGFVYQNFWQDSDTSKVALTLDNTGLNDLGIKQVPNLVPINSLGKLDGLLYQLDKNQAQAPTGSANSAEIQQAKAVPNGASPAKEIIDTSYPVKESVLRSAAKSAPSQARSGAVVPDKMTGDKTFSEAKVERADVRLVEVEKFDKALAYELSRRTWVMSKPSSFATPISELSAGERVWVVARVGEWLKLRSKEGTRVGYIKERFTRRLNKR